MKNYRSTLILAVVLLLAVVGCSNPSSLSGVTPDPDNASVLTGKIARSSAMPYLGGIYNIYVSENGEVSISSMRHADYAFNIVSLIDHPPFHIGVEVESLEHVGDHTNFNFNMSITHPAPGFTAVTAFDLCGIIMGNGNLNCPYDPSCGYSGNMKILNADGYTRWMNRPEFQELTVPIFGYTDGLAGTPGYSPTAIINPYKYFADGLGATDNLHNFLVANYPNRGMFSSTSTNTREYQLQFSDTTGFTFQYAILAHWAPNVNSPNPPVNIPGDFPNEANAHEPVAIHVSNDTSTMWFNPTDIIGGGNFTADISVVDWHTQPNASDLMEAYTIYLYSTAWTGGISPSMQTTGHGDNWASFHVNIPANPIAIGALEVWIAIQRTGETYANPFGIVTGADAAPLTSHFTYLANVVSSGIPTDWEPPTDHPPRLLFIHHSIGEGFLYDGGMWDKLSVAGFEVHDCTYGDGWIGDNTDPVNWPVTFTDYYNEMITFELPAGQFYDIVAFKSCYPSSGIESDDMLTEYYGYYNAIKAITNAHPETLFIPFTTPPMVPSMTNPEAGARARIFAGWLTGAYDDPGNLDAYDVFNILAGDNPANEDFNFLRNIYQSAPDNSHPNVIGSTAVADDFTAWLVSKVWD
jgi:hypothetical protein